ncbi:hypothetical protein JMK10_20895 [Rhodovulum sulfidophilum]|uniref:hypothetical protein n=1 Tax=Rhodovulum sulfidophilum TaxID=35806 RepID=UPI0019242A34|nr:hypothetical protein [Rhodovulum sulfidophilum]MBL3576117.1 hypothetical protein [Rhodovulum sulfidophilum]MCE8433311.1 hypothetical protein [Rhodovulum sulfidophilum]MCF4119134.1 hypothetical protein [Rhodovulum sulfidophilum]
MADNPKRQHYLGFDAQGAFWVLRVNGVDLWTQSSTGLYSSSLPVNHMLKKGENTVSLVHVATRKLDPKTGESLLEHHDHFGAEIRLRAIARDGSREEIHLLSVRYEVDGGPLKRLPQPLAGGEFVTETAHLKTEGDLRGTFSPVEDGAVLVLGSGESDPAETLTVRFTVDDDLPGDFFWEDKAVPLQDTPEMRAGLRRAYQDIHGLFEEGRFRAYLDIVRPVWARAGQTIAGGKSAEEFVGGEQHLREKYRRNRDDGSTLSPLLISADPGGDSLEFMADHRLVRIRPDPLRWNFPPEAHRNDRRVPAVFFRDADGAWYLADIVMN